MRITPKDSVDALRLMHKHQDALLQDGDDAEVKETVQGVVAVYVAGRREGSIGEDVEFLDWYENGDATEAVEPDPTA
jgi:hypothetical protein